MGNITPVRVMPNVANINAKLAFTCAYEKDHVPSLPPEADIVFKYARYLERENLIKNDIYINEEIARLYRISAANGHWKANVHLQLGLTNERFKGLMSEVLNLNDILVKQNIPAGFYHMGRFFENGTGYDQNHELALRYFRKSADMGSPEGQYYVADKFAPINIAPEVARQIRRCTAEQGHGKAALTLGIDLQGDHVFSEAIQAFQLGVKAGNDVSALALEEGFLDPKPDNRLNFLGQIKDDEPAHRYRIIGKFLSDYSYLNPTVEEIDDIVLLPPAKLPHWDGSLKWLKAYKANIAPAKPSEELIAKLAKAKGLDPVTGLIVKTK